MWSCIRAPTLQTFLCVRMRLASDGLVLDWTCPNNTCSKWTLTALRPWGEIHCDNIGRDACGVELHHPTVYKPSMWFISNRFIAPLPVIAMLKSMVTAPQKSSSFGTVQPHTLLLVPDLFIRLDNQGTNRQSVRSVSRFMLVDAF